MIHLFFSAMLFYKLFSALFTTERNTSYKYFNTQLSRLLGKLNKVAVGNHFFHRIALLLPSHVKKRFTKIITTSRNMYSHYKTPFLKKYCDILTKKKDFTKM